MKFSNEFPPNYAQIKVFGLGDSKTLFCFGDTVYNPFKLEIPPDVEFHEAVHVKQQTKYASPEYWWVMYLNNPVFRLQEELEAYARQYNFVKRTLNNKAAKECLAECAENLSGKVYRLGLTFHQAHTLIRKKSLEV